MQKLLTTFGLAIVATTVLAAASIIPLTAGRMSVVNGVIQFTTPPAGTNRSALYFTKTYGNDPANYIATTNTYGFDLFGATNTSCSIVLWAYTAPIGGDNEYAYMGQENSYNGRHWRFERVDGWGYSCLVFSSSDDEWGNAVTMFSSVGFMPTHNSWHLIGLVKTNDSYTFSIDATNDSAQILSTPRSVTCRLFIGAYGENVQYQRAFSGRLTSVLIYNRALANSDLTNIYNAGAGTITPPTEGLVNCWKCNEGSGTNVADSVGGNSAVFGPAERAPTWTNWGYP